MRTTQKEFPLPKVHSSYFQNFIINFIISLKETYHCEKNYEQKNKVCKGILFRSAANEQLCTPKNSLVSCGDKTLVR